jgi:hypothetical protein
MLPQRDMHAKGSGPVKRKKRVNCMSLSNSLLTPKA